ncbi:phage head closure protein [Paucibacter sp. R3-3]|uniref:Phage head closure protein n=1 Tax=Roseateles agri TaxID=3098619 RepID=A0ABU5DQ95_9BURK|nr:phage head closure protein [Paucibacter sp. R3-3]MDY0748507.1 phage head closure protein [Paucibacter sp. R3-3]
MATRIYSAGQLNQRVQFQVRAEGANELDEPTGGWINDGDPVWASMQPLRGSERLQAAAIQQTMDTVIAVRYSSARPAEAIIARGLRLIWLRPGTPFDIGSAIAVDGGLDWIEILATSGMRDGR